MGTPQNLIWNTFFLIICILLASFGYAYGGGSQSLVCNPYPPTSGISGFYVNVDDSGTTPFVPYVEANGAAVLYSDVDSLGNGSHVFRVQAVNRAGRRSETSPPFDTGEKLSPPLNMRLRIE